MLRRGGALLLLLAFVAGSLPGGSSLGHGAAAHAPHASVPVASDLQAPLVPTGGTLALADLLSGADPRQGPGGSGSSSWSAATRPPSDGLPTEGWAGPPAGIPGNERLARAGLLAAVATAVPPPSSD